MKFERCTNLDCRRPFQVNEFDFEKDGAYTSGYTCPHCGHTQTAFSNSVILVHALSEEQEAEFNREHPLEERVK
ncbi:MAG TPA: hypothetical protein VEC06_15890 [Paucimonas sp.]|nr:hypothetical protein [Paucimonas sp.]